MLATQSDRLVAGTALEGPHPKPYCILPTSHMTAPDVTHETLCISCAQLAPSSQRAQMRATDSHLLRLVHADEAQPKQCPRRRRSASATFTATLANCYSLQSVSAVGWLPHAASIESAATSCTTAAATVAIAAIPTVVIPMCRTTCVLRCDTAVVLHRAWFVPARCMISKPASILTTVRSARRVNPCCPRHHSRPQHYFYRLHVLRCAGGGGATHKKAMAHPRRGPWGATEAARRSPAACGWQFC